MAIFRGIGGAGDSTTDATVTAVTEQATNAANSATAAASSASSASSSASAASTSASNAASSASSASTSAANAATSASNAASSASSASTSATNAAASETAAGASETAAAASESAAATSASAAASSASSASSSASTATTKASEASASASAASTSASNAATSETNAASSASSAASSASSASASADAALAALDNFDDRYLGQKASDPSVDNDGNALVAGALYFNTTDNVMKVYEGSSWVAAYASLSGALLASNNLSDVASVSTARTNLGLGTAATTASTDYATAAQGSLADSAIQPSDTATLTGLTLSGGTANGVTYLNGSKVLTSGSALTFDGTTIGVKGSGQLVAVESTGDYSSSGSGFIRFKDSTGNRGYIGFGGTSNLMTFSNTIASANINFELAGSEKMRLTSTGLGIGTSSPGQKLSVNGNIDAFSTTASPIVLSTSDQAAGFYPASLRMRRRGAGGTATPNGQTIGQIRFDGASVGDVYDNLAIIEVIGGTNAVGGMPSSMHFHTASSGANATLRMTLDSSGNLGLGVTPSAWSSTYKAIQLGLAGSVYGRTASINMAMSSNEYVNVSGVSTYITTTGASRYLQTSGTHQWYIAPSGTAGNAISFTQAMTLDASGRLGIGTSSPSYKLQVQGSAASDVELLSLHNSDDSSSGVSSSIIARVGTSSVNSVSKISFIRTASAYHAGAMTFSTRDGSGGGMLERMRIHSSGNVGIGTSSPTTKLDIEGSSGDLLKVAVSGVGTGYLGVEYGYTYINANTGGAGIRFETQSAERMRIDSSGNVGIGTSSPARKLHVATLPAGDGIRVSGPTGDNNWAGGIEFYSNNGTTVTSSILASSSGMLFNYGGGERMRIDSSGNLLIGTTTVGGVNGVTIDDLTVGARIKLNKSYSGTATGVSFSHNSVVVGTITYSNTATAYNTSSDYRLKENIQDVTGSGVFIDSLQPRTWNWKFDGSAGAGFIAHELQAVSPSSVFGTKDAVDADGNPEYQAVEYGSAEVIAMLVAEVKSLRKRLADAGIA